jgi:hypothetical protein
MDLDSIRNILKYKTSKTTLCLKDVSRADQFMVYRLVAIYPDRLTVCCPKWSVWINPLSCVVKHQQESEQQTVLPHSHDQRASQTPEHS